ncbi:beta-1,3-galactosyltransferase GALT1-like [Zingiber officinale]|uniref:Galectin domain-containing protein n=1 Tax=Zingiber officinale TaxID=94328 RepID=A0A8J5FVT6_ZINOF|nr:beta-1,3-galactosyltransferase GALT1-like [Zingiber officinale]KAG6496865.1 hypothetical protein ZIOFF_044740 [Zingiber officinale]
MKIWSGGVVLGFLFTLLILRYGILENPLAERLLQSHLSHNSSEHLEWVASENAPAIQNPGDGYSVVSANVIAQHLFTQRNLSETGKQSLQTWYHLHHLVNHSIGLPQAVEALGEASSAWESLMAVIEGKNSSQSNLQKDKDKQCPYSIKNMNASGFADGTFKLKIPCGLIQGSSITIIGTPGGLVGNFRIDLVGTALPGEPDPPIILHYNVRLQGDKLTEDPVIVQNTWSATNDWGEEERCPSSNTDSSKKVDDLEQCSSMVGNDDKKVFTSSRHRNVSKPFPLKKEGDKQRKYFPFRQGFLSIATIRVGIEGIQMTVDGRHITSFAFRESLEPWLVSEVRISGDIKLISVLASGLPTSEDFEHVMDLELLKSNPITMHQAVHLFIGIFSTANNFKQRMAVRRTWMQYDAVKTGIVVLRFFVGLHKNQMVNEELWNEAVTYGDIQLMPFVDYYSLITLKTIAICIYGTNVLSAKYIMKTDDDAFVRVDEVLSSLAGANITSGLLYGRINSDSQPHRNVESKWYISLQEWPDEKYPPWAHGPGYVVSRDIAESVHKRHKEGSLKMFKLEDVAMGIWIEEMKKKGSDIKYVNEGRISIDGCEAGYVLAHYQEPREMLCLWQKFQETKRARCCGE